VNSATPVVLMTPDVLEAVLVEADTDQLLFRPAKQENFVGTRSLAKMAEIKLPNVV
jgi:hypothetical protein